MKAENETKQGGKKDSEEDEDDSFAKFVKWLTANFLGSSPGPGPIPRPIPKEFRGVLRHELFLNPRLWGLDANIADPSEARAVREFIDTIMDTAIPEKAKLQFVQARPEIIYKCIVSVKHGTEYQKVSLPEKVVPFDR